MQSTMQKIPGIGDIPILGYLFRSKVANKEQTELVVMITPENLQSDSVGVTNTLPRTPDTFMPPVTEKQAKPPLPPAFGPQSRSQADAVPVPAPALKEAGRTLDASERAALAAAQQIEAQQRAAADRELRLALLRSTETCKGTSDACAGGKYDATPSPRRAEALTRYNTARMNRHDGPEDGSLSDRCLPVGLPEFGTAYGGSFRRIVQTPGGVSIFYDVGQGQGFQRNIVMNESPHLPASVRQWFGDSRGRWEGDTLVIDVTNFSSNSDFMGSRENLHLVERWTRTGPTTLEYAVTIEDPTVWARPWTVKEEFSRQNDQENRIYYEPRCHEGNLGMVGLLQGARNVDRAYAERRGPHPASLDISSNSESLGTGINDPR